MSEPGSKMDMNALTEALEVSGEVDNPAQPKAPEESVRDTLNKSNTLNESKRDAGDAVDKGSPETISPSGSPVGRANEVDEVPAKVVAQAKTTSINEPQHDRAPLDPTTKQIKSMFPDLDVDTIQAVVVAEGGDFERAINTLLQMSDPSYVPPPPFRGSDQTDADEQLARSIAADEDRAAQRQASHSVRGGGLGAFFGASGQGQSAPQQSSPSYDPNNLSYQPRVRRNPSSQTSVLAQQASTRPTPPTRTVSGDEQGSSVWPGPKDAKQWQEDINKMAETGFAKAASTFSALRQRGEQAWANRSSPGMSEGGIAGGAGGASSGGQPSGQRGGSFFSGWNQRAGGAGHSTVSPTIGSSRGFDRDPSPVGDNELAKILARGRSNDDDERDGSAQRKSSMGSIANRYKNVVAAQRSRGDSRQAKEHNDDDDGANDGGALGWDDAGRTGTPSNAAEKSFEPIKISDNSSAPSSAQSATFKSGQRNAVSLMEGSAGRGVTSPRTSTGPNDERRTNDAHGADDDDDDDLEYVANPFEDDD